MSNRKKIIIGVIVIGIVGFLGIQLIPVDRTNPPVRTQITWDSPATETLIRQACYDCHSNETVWPWYAYVAPVSWLAANDVKEGRDHLNFSEQAANRIRTGELIEVIREGEMPPGTYRIMHPKANLDDAEKAQLIAGIQASLSG